MQTLREASANLCMVDEASEFLGGSSREEAALGYRDLQATSLLEDLIEMTSLACAASVVDSIRGHRPSPGSGGLTSPADCRERTLRWRYGVQNIDHFVGRRGNLRQRGKVCGGIHQTPNFSSSSVSRIWPPAALGVRQAPLSSLILQLLIWP